MFERLLTATTTLHTDFGKQRSARRKQTHVQGHKVGVTAAKKSARRSQQESSKVRRRGLDRVRAPSLRTRKVHVDYKVLAGWWGATIRSSSSEQDGKGSVDADGGGGKRRKMKRRLSDGGGGGRGGQVEEGGECTKSSGREALTLKKRMQSKLSRARYLENMLDAYQQVRGRRPTCWTPDGRRCLLCCRVCLLCCRVCFLCRRVSAKEFCFEPSALNPQPSILISKP
jgi:hypothetical protein